MLLLRLLSHSWKAFWRSPALPGRIVGLVFRGFIWIVALVNLLVFGLVLPLMIEVLRPDDDPIALINSYTLAALGVYFVFRFIAEKAPDAALRAYLPLPFGRKKVLSSIVALMSITPFVIFPVFFFLPFSIGFVLMTNGWAAFGVYFAGMHLVLIAQRYLILLLRTGPKSLTAVLVAGLVAFFAFALAQGHTVLGTMEKTSFFVFSGLMEGRPSMLIVLAAGAVGVVAAYYVVLQKQAYFDVLDAGPTFDLRKGGAAGRFFERPATNAYKLEAMLVLRNAQPRAQIVWSVISSLALIVLYFEKPNLFQNMGPAIWLLATGVFLFQYGGICLGLEGSYFDGLLSYNFDARRYVRLKFFGAQACCGLSFLLTMPVMVYYGQFPMAVALLLYNAGISVFFVLLAAVWTSNRSMSLYKHVSNDSMLAPWLRMLVMAPALIIPYLVLGVAGGDVETTYMAVGAMGLLGLGLSPLTQHAIYRTFQHRRLLLAQRLRGNRS